MMEKVQGENVGLLLRQLKDGSEPAFNALYRLHSTMLLANIRNLVRDQETAKELLQELYLKVWENREHIDETKSYRAYLFTIARNMVYNHFRKVAMDNKAKLRLINEITEAYEYNHAGLDDAANTALLQDAVQSLSPQCREVYRLSRMEGKSHEEIGQMMGISPSTVNNHIVKAKRQMRSFLANNHDLAVILVSAWAINQMR